MTLGAATGVKAQQRQQVAREEAARAAMACLNRSNTRPICTMQELIITLALAYTPTPPAARPQ